MGCLFPDVAFFLKVKTWRVIWSLSFQSLPSIMNETSRSKILRFHTKTRLLKEDNYWSGPSSWNCSLETIQYSLKFDLAWLSFIGIFFVHRLSLYVAVIADIIQSKKILLAFTFCLFQKTSLMLFFNLFYLADLLLQLSNVSTWAVWWNNQFWGIVIKNVELPLSANLIKGVVHHFKWWR